MPSNKVAAVIEALPAELKKLVLALKAKHPKRKFGKEADAEMKALAYSLHRAGVTFRATEDIMPLRRTSGMNASRLADIHARLIKAQAEKARRQRIKAEKLAVA
jgi:hypothetical protein